MAGLPADVVLIDGEPVSPVTYSQDARRLILGVSAIRRVGSDRRLREYLQNGQTRTTWTGQRVVTVQLRAENYGVQEGYEFLEDLRTQLDTPEIGEALNTIGVALNLTQDINVLDVTSGNRVIGVAVIDVLFNWASTRTRTGTLVGDYIATVEAVGEEELAGALVQVAAPTLVMPGPSLDFSTVEASQYLALVSVGGL